MKYRFILTMALFMAGILFGISLAGPEVYAAPEAPTPPLCVKGLPTWLTAASDREIESEHEKALYREYIYEPLILRPQIERLIAKYNANVSKIERLTAEEREQVIDAIITSSKVYDLDPLLVASVMAAESSFRIRDRWGEILESPCGAIGLMQIMPYHGWRGDLTTIAANVDTGCWYLRLSIDRTPTVKLAIAAYNAGPKRPEWALKNRPETRVYVPKVMRVYEGLRKEG